MAQLRQEIAETRITRKQRHISKLSALSSDGLIINVPADTVEQLGVRDIVDAVAVAKSFEILRTLLQKGRRTGLVATN